MKEYSPCVWLMESVEHLHQRRFSRPVFADDGVNFPALQRKVCAVIRYDGSKPFRDAAHGNQWSGSH
jgi:hypothetical protein